MGHDANNLKDAIAGETSEINTMYFRFAQQAETVGNFAVAKLFREVREDEMVHRASFQEALAKLNKQVAGN